MQMIYNSDSFTVVQYSIPADASPMGATEGGADRGGYEIVDKFARKEIFLQGAMAQSFQLGVENLIQTRPSEEEVDDFIDGFTALMQQPLALH